jgi:hypothetical protein
MTEPEPTVLGHSLVEHYEVLRRVACGDAAVAGSSRGLALLMHNGMARWVQTLRRCAPPARAENDVRAESPASTAHSEMVTVLAEMTMAAATHTHTQEKS